MFRLFLYFIGAVIIGLLFLYLTSFHGIVTLQLVNYSITTPLWFGAILLITSFFTLYFIYYLFKNIILLPSNTKKYFHEKRLKQYEQNMQQAILAVLSGDNKTARYYINMLDRSTIASSNNNMLIDFLKAEVNILDSDMEAAVKNYEAMLNDKKTKLLGLFGLYRLARGANSHLAASNYALEAYKIAPELPWASYNLLEQAIIDKDWHKAQKFMLSIANSIPIKAHAINHIDHKKAILNAAIAADIFDVNRDEARKLIIAAHKLDSDFVPITTIGARIFYNLNESKKADKWLETLWQITPHKDLANSYIYGQNLPASRRLERAKYLESLAPDHIESYIILAFCYYESSQYLQAQNYAQKALAIDERKDIYLLLADIEEARRGDSQLVRNFLSKANKASLGPNWVGDGVILDKWQILSPITHSFDTVCYEYPSVNPELITDNNIDCDISEEQQINPLAEDKDIQNSNAPKIIDTVWYDNNEQLDKIEKEHFTVDDPGVSEDMNNKSKLI